MEQELEWLGLVSDESPTKGGDVGPYQQSERLSLYTKFVQELFKKDAVYYCFCSSEKLSQMRKKQQEKNQPPKYDGTCRSIDLGEAATRAQNESHVVRLKLPEAGTFVHQDIVRGKVEFNYKDLDDQVLVKSDGFPTYHLASVLDDHLMGITHVIRSEEWLPSIPKHVFLLESLGLTVPQFAHVPMVLSGDRAKMSKRRDGEMVWVKHYRKLGYLPEAIVNYMAFLGWNPKTTREIYSLDELIAEFDLSQVNKAGAVFDVKKLNHINSQYIRALSDDEYVKRCMEHLKEKGFDASLEGVEQAVLLEKDRLEFFDQVGDSTAFFFEPLISCEKENLLWKDAKPSEARGALLWAKDVLSKDSVEWTVEALESFLIEEIASAGKSNGEVLFPLRYAITGQKYSPTPFECLVLLGKDRALERVQKAIAVLS